MDIRDIRGPIAIPYPWLLPLLAVAIGAVLGLVLWAVLRRRRRPAAPPPPIPADVLALQRLERARALMEPPRAREFGAAVSEAVRLYIEARFDERAAHRTTEEFLHDLLGRAGSLLSRHAPLLDDFLRHCDLAKFARHPLSVSEMQAMHRSAVTFVQETCPPAP